MPLGVIRVGTTIIGDRLFSSVKLLQALARLDLHYVGTARKNAKGVPKFNPAHFKGAQERGSSTFKVVKSVKNMVIGTRDAHIVQIESGQSL
eukprot:1149569-Prorocentrum_minimum.AAC.2